MNLISFSDFTSWAEELRAAFDSQGLLLTATVPIFSIYTDQGSQVSTLAKILHQIHLLPYDIHPGSWDPLLGHHSPLYPAPGQPQVTSLDLGIEYWIHKGVPPGQLVLGVPFHGQAWMFDRDESQVSGAARPGPALGEAGVVAYNVLCLVQVTEDWKKTSDENGVYLTNGKQWIGYDDDKSITRKVSTTT